MLSYPESFPELANELNILAAQYKDAAQAETFEKALLLLSAASCAGMKIPSPGDAEVQKLFFDTAYFQPTWGYLLASLLWRNGARSPNEFLNIWNCSLQAGFHNRYCKIPTAALVPMLEKVRAGFPCAAAYLVLGNAVRQMHGYSRAEDIYLEGCYRFPDDPFLKLRLVDLYLATYRLQQARQLLLQLQPLYPFAREMMFVVQADDRLPDLPPQFDSLSGGDKKAVCFVAADPGYMDKYAAAYAESIARCSGQDIHCHFHVARAPDTPTTPETVARLKQLVPSLTITERVYNLAALHRNRRMALFASERFLVLAEILEKYRKPIIVSDIDVEFLRNPCELLGMMDQGDIGWTNFRNTTEAWERYAATVLAVHPTEEAILFFRRMGKLIWKVLNEHAQPWFVDQIGLFRMMEEFGSTAHPVFLPNILTDSEPPAAGAFCRILHASWEV